MRLETSLDSRLQTLYYLNATAQIIVLWSGKRLWRSLPSLKNLVMTSMDKRRILIVDNNDELRTMLERALGALGHEVLTTGNRAEAMARDDLDGFDLIISDLP